MTPRSPSTPPDPPRRHALRHAVAAALVLAALAALGTAYRLLPPSVGSVGDGQLASLSAGLHAGLAAPHTEPRAEPHTSTAQPVETVPSASQVFAHGASAVGEAAPTF